MNQYPPELASDVPPGVIVMWSGSIANIPSGWALCDGTNGTPDLRDRFIVGAGSSYAVGAKGGSATISHNHSYSGTTSQASDDATTNGHDYSTTYKSLPTHTHTYSGNTSIVDLDNRPPYYALCFIMKL